MKDLFLEYWMDLNEKELLLFNNFLNIFINYNSKINLSSIRNEKDIIKKHFIDSILLNKYIKLNWNILDLWTWGGFPWIPLKIISKEENTNFILIDSISKKVKIVNEFIKELWLKNINSLQFRAEELWQNLTHREKYDFVVSRATAYLPTLLEYTLPLLKNNWIFIAYKLNNPNEKKESFKALKILWWKIINEVKYNIDNQERIYLFIQKISKTPKIYPREIWIPLKKPLI